MDLGPQGTNWITVSLEALNEGLQLRDRASARILPPDGRRNVPAT